MRMKVISSPPALKLNAVLLLLMPVLFAFQALVQATLHHPRAHAWRVMLVVWVTSEFLLWIPALGILRAKEWAVYWVGFLVFCWAMAVSFWIRWDFFSVMILMILFLLLYWIRREYAKSYLFSGNRWFSGLPQSIPRLVLYFEGKKDELFQVSRIDKNGVFAFNKKHKGNHLQEGAIAKIYFQYGDKTVFARVKWVSWDAKMGGLGLKFAKHSTDENKDLIDFIEHLSGKGYILSL